MRQRAFNFASDFDELDSFPLMQEDTPNAFGVVGYYLIRAFYRDKTKVFFNLDWAGILATNPKEAR